MVEELLIYIQRVSGNYGYDQLVYKKTPMTDNSEFPLDYPRKSTRRNLRSQYITICGDGGNYSANMDRLVIRQQGATGGGDNRNVYIRLPNATYSRCDKLKFIHHSLTVLKGMFLSR